MKLIAASTTIVFSLLASAALASQTRGAQTEGQSPKDDAQLAEMSPRTFKRMTVPGEQVEANVKRLTTRLRWHKHLGAALAEGKAKKKPVVWIQALGDLKGFL